VRRRRKGRGECVLGLMESLNICFYSANRNRTALASVYTPSHDLSAYRMHHRRAVPSSLEEQATWKHTLHWPLPRVTALTQRLRSNASEVSVKCAARRLHFIFCRCAWTRTPRMRLLRRDATLALACPACFPFPMRSAVGDRLVLCKNQQAR